MEDPEVDDFIRMGYVSACRARLSQQAQEEIVSHEEHQVRALLARSHHLDPDVLERLANDSHEHVRRTLAYNDSITEEVMLVLAAESSSMRVALLSHDTLPAPVVRFLARYQDTYPRLRDWIQHRKEESRMPVDLEFPARYLQEEHPSFVEEALQEKSVDREAWEGLLPGWDGSAADLVEATFLIKH